MAPPAAATARRSSARVLPRSLPSGPRRPPLRVFEPAPRRRPGIRPLRRSTMWVAGLLIVGSLLAVVVGDALITEGQVRLSKTQAQIAAAISTQKSLQVAVAGKAAPPVVVKQAKSQGLVAPSQVVYLPRVNLNVPLPVPRTTPAPTATTSSTAANSASAATSTSTPTVASSSSSSASSGHAGVAAGSTATTAPAPR
jgi:hypothetical protein